MFKYTENIRIYYKGAIIIKSNILKKIEKFRYVEGQKYENLSRLFPDGFKGLRNERDDTKSNFESNHYNISIQNAHEIRTFDKLNICDAI